MGFTEEARRWWRDQTTKDPDIREGGRPEVRVKELDQALNQLSAVDRQDQLNWNKAYAEKYYLKHQRAEQVPVELVKSLERLTKEAERLNRVERAEQVLEKYGGPPTRQTLEAAIERSLAARQRPEVTPAPTLSYSDPVRPKPAGPKSNIARGNGVNLEAKPLNEWTKAELAKEIKALREQYSQAMASGKPTAEIRAIVARDTAVRHAYAERVVLTPPAVKAEPATVKAAPGEPASTVRVEKQAVEKPAAVSLESYSSLAESLRTNRVNSERLSKAIDALSSEQIEQRLQQLEPLVQGKRDRGIEREVGLLQNALEWKREQPVAFHEEAWKATRGERAQPEGQPVKHELQKRTASEVVAELKSLREQLQDGIKNNASSKELQPLIHRDTAIRQARPDVVKAQVAEKMEGPKVSMGF
jgi:hypothetical protein